MFVILFSLLMSGLSFEVESSCKNFDCEYNLMAKLIHLEDKTSQQDKKIDYLTGKLEGKDLFSFFLS